MFSIFPIILASALCWPYIFKSRPYIKPYIFAWGLEALIVS